MKNVRRAVLAASAAAAALIPSAPASAINIVLNPSANFANQPNGAAALLAFQKAANFWNTVLSGTNTQINFNVDYRALGDGIIGSTGSTSVVAATADVYGALATHSATALDAVAVANLVPLTAAGGVGYRRPGAINPATGTGLNTAAGSVFDNNDSGNNLYLDANTANLKVLGFTQDADGNAIDGNTVDASITFSSAFDFDFDPTDGIANGAQDFIAVAVHEMGHALGFVSGTDTYDYYGGDPATGGKRGPGFATGLALNFDNYAVASIWDLFRRSSNGPSNSGFDPATGERYLQLDPNRGAGFAPDGVHFFANADGQFANFSTGRYTGDGQQASHWKDATGYFDENDCFVTNPQIGIMDPTSGTCQAGIVTAADLAAFDAMGYNLDFDVLNNRGTKFTTADIFNLPFANANAVPEASTWAMMIAGFGFVGGAMRRRKTAVSYAA